MHLLGPYSTHTTPILLLCDPQKPSTVIVVPLHYYCYIIYFGWCPFIVVASFGLPYILRRFPPQSGLLSNFLSLSSHGILILKFLCYFGIWFITIISIWKLTNIKQHLFTQMKNARNGGNGISSVWDASLMCLPYPK